MLIRHFGDPLLILIFLRPSKNNEDWPLLSPIIVWLVVQNFILWFCFLLVCFYMILAFCYLQILYFLFSLKRKLFSKILIKIHLKNSLKPLRSKTFSLIYIYIYIYATRFNSVHILFFIFKIFCFEWNMNSSMWSQINGLILILDELYQYSCEVGNP